MSSDSKAYIGGDPLPRPDISDRGKRGAPIKPKAHHRVHHTKRAAPAQTAKPAAKPAADPKPKTPNYRAPDNYSTYGRPGTNEMGPSSPTPVRRAQLVEPSPTPVRRAQLVEPSPTPVRRAELVRLPSTPAPSKLPSTFSTSGQAAGEAIEPALPKKQSKHGYRVKWS